MIDKVIKLKDGRNFGYAEYGVPSGTPVLFFHGTPGARLNPVCSIMDSIAKAIEGPSIRLIAMDRPGYGRSDVKPERTLDDWVSDVEELIDGLGINQFSIIAVSGGAPYAYACSAKLGNRVNKAAIVCGLGPVYLPEVLENLSQAEKGTLQAALLAPEKLAAYTQHVQANPAVFVENVIKEMSEQERKALSPELIDGFIGMLAESTKNPEGMISDYQIFAKDWGVRFDNLTVPFHFWHSESDQSVPIFHSEFLVELLPNADLTHLKGLNHNTTSLAVVKEVVGFIVK